MIKKLIEVALPLEKINAESYAERYARHGHPSTLHLWWARRPMTIARAVIWASMIDDPSSHPELFPTEEEQNKERQRLFRLLEDLVVWENSNNEQILNAAKNEIKKSINGDMPILLDPFAGGGAIPFEAARLGFEAHAHDLNPIAVMINKAMIEFPPKFSGWSPINPESRATLGFSSKSWNRCTGIAEDVRYYGQKIEKMTKTEIGHMFPDAMVPQNYGGGNAQPIAWIWARTVTCPNPMCKREVPLVKNFTLSKNSEVNASPIYSDDGKLSFDVEYTSKRTVATVKSTGAICPCCNQPISFEYIRKQAKNGKIGQALMSTVVDTKSRGRLYLPPDDEQAMAANINEPEGVPQTEMPNRALGFRVQAYGMTRYAQLFTNRQLAVLISLIDSLHKVSEMIEKDAIDAGVDSSHVSLENDGNGAKAYSDLVTMYLAFVIDRMADYNSTLCAWQPGGNKAANTFNRPALSMSWDFAEANPFSNAYGGFSNKLEWAVEAIQALPAQTQGYAKQANAQSDCGMRNIIVSTDPPYYDNIGYADLSDFFYIWLRKSLVNCFPSLFSTMLVPKSEELIATPYRNEGSQEKAKQFFEDGMLVTCKQLYKYMSDAFPMTIYYAFKQSDSTGVQDQNNGNASSGWETMLNAIIKSGFMITGTWPMRTEMPNRTRNMESNALASSIVLVCRKRPEGAPQTTRRNLINTLRRELRHALKRLQESNIAPVDLAQSAIGPGIGVFSRYKQVLEADGTPMSVRSALKVINKEIDLYFNEQVGDMDSASRFCVDMYTQYAYNDIKYGEAEVLATAKSASIPSMASRGVLYAKAGIVHLVVREELPEKVDANEPCNWMLTQQLTQAMARGGVEACAKILAGMFGSNEERAKDLAYRLYTIAERKNWANEAYAYNALVVAWPDIQARAAALKEATPEQLDLFSTGLLTK